MLDAGVSPWFGPRKWHVLSLDLRPGTRRLESVDHFSGLGAAYAVGRSLVDGGSAEHVVLARMVDPEFVGPRIRPHRETRIAQPYDYYTWVSAAQNVAKGWLDAAEVTEVHPGRLARDCHVAMIAAVASGQLGRYHRRPTPPLRHRGTLLYPEGAGYEQATDSTWHSLGYNIGDEPPVLASVEVAPYLDTLTSDIWPATAFAYASRRLLLRVDGRPSIQIAVETTFNDSLYKRASTVLGDHAVAAVAPLLVGHRGPKASLYAPLLAAVRAVSDRSDWDG